VPGAQTKGFAWGVIRKVMRHDFNNIR